MRARGNEEYGIEDSTKKRSIEVVKLEGPPATISTQWQ